MHRVLNETLGLAATMLLVMGCQNQSDPGTSSPATTPVQENAAEDHSKSDIEAALAELSPEDRKAAEAQKFCAVLDGSLLGSMGAPVKVDIKGEPVFVCCSGCKSDALKDPDKTLAALAKLKTENSADSK